MAQYGHDQQKLASIIRQEFNRNYTHVQRIEAAGLSEAFTSLIDGIARAIAENNTELVRTWERELQNRIGMRRS